MNRFYLRFVLVVSTCVFVLVPLQAPKAAGSQSPDDSQANQFVVSGRPLSFWVSKVSTELSAADQEATVEALISALSAEDTSACIRVPLSIILRNLVSRAITISAP